MREEVRHQIEEAQEVILRRGLPARGGHRRVGEHDVVGGADRCLEGAPQECVDFGGEFGGLLHPRVRPEDRNLPGKDLGARVLHLELVPLLPRGEDCSALPHPERVGGPGADSDPRRVVRLASPKRAQGPVHVEGLGNSETGLEEPWGGGDARQPEEPRRLPGGVMTHHVPVSETRPHPPRLERSLFLPAGARSPVGEPQQLPFRHCTPHLVPVGLVGGNAGLHRKA